MASFNQNPLGQTSSSNAIAPALTWATSSTSIIPTLVVTLYSWTGGMTAGGATMTIGSGTGDGSGGGGGPTPPPFNINPPYRRPQRVIQ